MPLKWNEWKIPILVIVLAIISVMYINYTNINQSDQGNKENPQILNTSVQNVTEPVINASGPSIIDNDSKFKIWLSMSYTPISNDLKCISKAANYQNFTSTGLCAKFLKEDSNRSLEQIDSYNVSPSIKPMLDQYKRSLENYSIGGKYLEIGARNMDKEQMGIAIKYIKQANDILTNLSYGNTVNTNLSKIHQGINISGNISGS